MRKLRTFIIIGLLILACFILQSSLFRVVTFGGIGPNLMIALVCSLALMFGDIYGAVIGFLSGLMCDIFFSSSGALGMNALIYAITGFLAGKFEKLVFPEDIKIPTLCILAGDFISGFLSFCLNFLIRGRMVLPYFLVHFLLPEMLYTLLISLLLYPLLLVLYRKYMRPIRDSEINYGRKKKQVF